MKKYLQFFKKIKMITTLSFLFLLSFQLKSQCNGSFSATAGAPGVVNFSSTSVGISTSVSYSWLFGDGASLYYNFANANVSHTYTTNGNYNVIMIMLDYGNSCSDTVYNTITVNNIPNPFSCNIAANFTHTLGNSGNVNFNSTSTGISANAGYSWYFGDGAVLNNSASNTNVVHTYTNNGTYNVYMILRDFNSFGNLCQDTVNYSVAVSNVPLCPGVANFTLVKDTAFALKWNAYPIYAPTTNAVLWLFGDGASSTLFFPTHNYANAGLYNVCLIVTDVCGATDTLCLNTNIFKVANNNSAMISLDVIAPVVLGVNDNLNNPLNFKVFPNPSDGEFTITSKSDMAFKIVNELGQVVKTININAGNNFTYKVGGLNTGMYFITSVSRGKTIQQKIIITK
jgi:PKD repeat protein